MDLKNGMAQYGLGWSGSADGGVEAPYEQGNEISGSKIIWKLLNSCATSGFAGITQVLGVS
jgi:hypothetical protein